MYLLIFPDIIITRGANRTLVFDTKKAGSFSYIPVIPEKLLERFRETTIEAISQSYSGEDLQIVKGFIDFILENKYGVLVQDIDHFPNVVEDYESPSVVEIMVIDIAEKEHRYSFIASQLRSLCCEHLQLRFFSSVSIAKIRQVLSPFLVYPWFSIELLISNPLWEDPQEIVDFLYDLPMVSIIVFNQNETKIFNVNSKYRSQSISSVLYTRQHFNSPMDCGVIHKDTLYNMSTLQSVIMSKKHNNCLYKKVFITKEGDVANCPCLPYTYGNIDKQDIVLTKIVKSEIFQKKWEIIKDDIFVCRDCEFRYVCNDCRAFLDNLLEKPRKCTYNPYTSQWYDS